MVAKELHDVAVHLKRPNERCRRTNRVARGIAWRAILAWEIRVGDDWSCIGGNLKAKQGCNFMFFVCWCALVILITAVAMMPAGLVFAVIACIVGNPGELFTDLTDHR